MNLVERLLGFWPDNGDGSIELLLISAAIASAAAAWLKWFVKRPHTHVSPSQQ